MAMHEVKEHDEGEETHNYKSLYIHVILEKKHEHEMRCVGGGRGTRGE